MKDASRLSVCSLLCVPLYENLPSLDHSWLTPDESGHLLPDWLDESILPVNHIPVNHINKTQILFVDKHKEGGPERKEWEIGGGIEREGRGREKGRKL